MRAVVVPALVAILLSGCGRVSFDATPDALADAQPDVAAACFVPLDSGALVSDGGFAWMILAPLGMFGLADRAGVHLQSTLRLFEDGIELGPAHAAHVDIRTIGLGRFSHWTTTGEAEDSIRFSASDNSDPRSNGRQYAYCP